MPLVVAAVAILLLGWACSANKSTSASGSATPSASVANPTASPVTREVLGSEPAPSAPGYTEYLMRVTIQPGAKLADHYHPGIQIARIESGTLTYDIVTGTVGVGRAGSPTQTEQVTATAQVTLNPGDTVYENEGLVHHAENAGKVPVVVLLAALFKSDQGVAVNVNIPPTM